MATKTTTDRAEAKREGARSKAKAAYDKGAARFGEAKTFTKGNVDAVVESGRILGAGLKQLGEGYVAEGKNAAATVNADIKDLAAVRSPADFFKLQSKIVGRNFGSAIDFQAKNAEAVLKLAQDSAAPLSQRFGIFLDALRKAA